MVQVAWNSHIAQTSLKLVIILLPQPLGCWDYRRGPPFQTCIWYQGSTLTSCVVDKPSAADLLTQKPELIGLKTVPHVTGILEDQCVFLAAVT